jgi:hypothetical protein
MKLMPFVTAGLLAVGCSGAPERTGYDGWFDYPAMRDNRNYRDHPQCPQWSFDDLHRHRRNNCGDPYFPGNPDIPNATQWCDDQCNPNNCQIQFKHWYRYNRKTIFSD